MHRHLVIVYTADNAAPSPNSAIPIKPPKVPPRCCLALFSSRRSFFVIKSTLHATVDTQHRCKPLCNTALR
jgi:hypothetical protein